MAAGAPQLERFYTVPQGCQFIKAGLQCPEAKKSISRILNGNSIYISAHSGLPVLR